MVLDVSDGVARIPLRHYLEDVAFLMNRRTMIIGLGGFKLDRLVAYRAIDSILSETFHQTPFDMPKRNGRDRQKSSMSRKGLSAR